MISEITIENFRGVRAGKVDGLGAVSILVGPNNSGKSTCLEAIEIVGRGKRFDLIGESLGRRSGSSQEPIPRYAIHRNAAFALLRTDSQGSILALGKSEAQRGGKALQALGLTDGSYTALGRAYFYVGSKASPSNGFQVRHLDALAVRAPRALENAYSEIDLAGRLTAVLGALRASMPTLQDLRILKDEEGFVLHTFMSDGARVPTYLAGDGFKRLLELASALSVRESVVLLEEPECFLHPRYLRELVSLIQHAVTLGTQVILSTHSLELIDALLLAEGWPDDATYPTVHRTRLDEGQLRATRIERKQAIAAREVLVEDLRS